MFPLDKVEMVIMYYGSFFIVCSVLFSVKDLMFPKNDGECFYEAETSLTKEEFDNDYYHLWRSRKMGVLRNSFSGVNIYPVYMKAALKNDQIVEYTLMTRNRKLKGVYFDDFIYVGIGKLKEGLTK